MKLKKKWLQKKALDGGSKVAALSDAASSSVIAVPGEGVVAVIQSPSVGAFFLQSELVGD